MSAIIWSAVERPVAATRFVIRFGFGQTGIDNAALGRGVFIVSGREFGSVDQHGGGDDDLAAVESKLHRVSFKQASLASYAGWDSDLAFILDSCGGTDNWMV
jgi:hypothetical protein